MINGYLTVESPKGRYLFDGKNFTYPKWSEKNTLRICMQIWDGKNTSYIEQFRWVLNYTYPT